MHAWAQVRHRHDSGAHASRYVYVRFFAHSLDPFLTAVRRFPGMPEKRVGSGTKTYVVT
jgi:hypothetical protein